MGSNRNGLASIRVSKEGTARRRKMYTESLFELLLIGCWALIVILLLIGCFGFAVAGLTWGVETVLTMGQGSSQATLTRSGPLPASEDSERLAPPPFSFPDQYHPQFTANRANFAARRKRKPLARPGLLRATRARSPRAV